MKKFYISIPTNEWKKQYNRKLFPYSEQTIYQIFLPPISQNTVQVMVRIERISANPFFTSSKDM